jgi:FAD/FMN-containing dehydrogenase
MRGMKGIAVDPKAKTIRAEAGLTWGEFDAATQEHGLVCTGGRVTTTGIAGLSLGSGSGWLERKFGFVCDNLIEAEVVTADGRKVKASEKENADLFWGLRGGGGNFGVVTSFTFRAHPLPERPFTGNFLYSRERWAQALSAYEEWTRDIPDELTSILTILVPPAGMQLGTDPLLMLGFAWSSADTQRAEALVDRMHRAAPPTIEAVDPVSWIAWQSSVDAFFPKGSRGYWKNTSFDRLDDEVRAVLSRRGAEQSWVGTGFDIHHLGGAYGRVAEDATPFPSRAARFWLNIYGFWADPAEDAARIAFIRAFGAEMEPLGTGGTYLNFLGAETDADPSVQDRRVFSDAKLRRLAALKRAYDPQNILRQNHNILPAPATGDSE